MDSYTASTFDVTASTQFKTALRAALKLSASTTVTILSVKDAVLRRHILATGVTVDYSIAVQSNTQDAQAMTNVQQLTPQSLVTALVGAGLSVTSAVASTLPAVSSPGGTSSSSSPPPPSTILPPPPAPPVRDSTSPSSPAPPGSSASLTPSSPAAAGADISAAAAGAGGGGCLLLCLCLGTLALRRARRARRRVSTATLDEEAPRGNGKETNGRKTVDLGAPAWLHCPAENAPPVTTARDVDELRVLRLSLAPPPGIDKDSANHEAARRNAANDLKAQRHQAEVAAAVGGAIARAVGGAASAVGIPFAEVRMHAPCGAALFRCFLVVTLSSSGDCQLNHKSSTHADCVGASDQGTRCV